MDGFVDVTPEFMQNNSFKDKTLHYIYIYKEDKKEDKKEDNNNNKNNKNTEKKTIEQEVSVIRQVFSEKDRNGVLQTTLISYGDLVYELNGHMVRQHNHQYCTYIIYGADKMKTDDKNVWLIREGQST